MKRLLKTEKEIKYGYELRISKDNTAIGYVFEVYIGIVRTCIDSVRVMTIVGKSFE